MMRTRKIFSYFAVLLFLLTAALPVYAAEVFGPAQGKADVTISAQAGHKNVYAAGATVTVNSDISGDLAAAGGSVNVTGKVQQEALLAGGSLDLSGAVGGTARLFGGNITVSGPIGGDLAIAGQPNKYYKQFDCCR